jgi:hypothetical protein
MKNIHLFFILLFSLNAVAQKEVVNKVYEQIYEGKVFKHYVVLTPDYKASNISVNKVVNRATLATIKEQLTQEIFLNHHENLELEIPYQGKIIEVLLYRVTVFSDGFHVDTDKSKSVSFTKGVHYRGMVKGDRNSLVSFNFFENEINGMITTSQFGNIVVGKLTSSDNTKDYIIYSDQMMKISNDFECKTKDDNVQMINDNSSNTTNNTTKCVSMYFELKNNLYVLNDNDVTKTTNWMTSVFNNVQTLFANDGINVSMKSIFIWTEKDPYTAKTAAENLTQFDEITPFFDADLGQLIGADIGELGGVAADVNGLCNSENYSYSDVNLTYETVPVYSWTVLVITHEMGHLLGSQHTHACIWNGNNTAIDNCSPVYEGTKSEGYPCLTNPPTLPSTTEKGTIMSYCHLISSIGINFLNGFGPQPKEAILNTINSQNCLSTDCKTLCNNTITNIVITNITNSSATITWEELGDYKSWAISVTTLSTIIPKLTIVTTPSLTVNNLLPNTYYKILLAPICDQGLKAPSVLSLFVTTADYCNGITITDTGGTAGDYTNGEHIIRTLIPNLSNKKIKLNFTKIDLEKDYDFLYVYDGNSTDAPLMINGELTGTFTNKSFTSSASDGSLTLEFISDNNTTKAGYVANVSCENSLSNKEFLSTIDFTYSPNPSDGIVTIQSNTLINEVSIYNIEGRLLFQNKVYKLDPKIDISTFETGTYFFKLKFEEKEVTFKILKK